MMSREAPFNVMEDFIASPELKRVAFVAGLFVVAWLVGLLGRVFLHRVVRVATRHTAWRWDTDGDVLPLHVPVHIGSEIVETVRAKVAGTGAPLWCPWPLLCRTTVAARTPSPT